MELYLAIYIGRRHLVLKYVQVIAFLKKLDPSSAFIFIIKRHNDFCMHTIMLPLEVILKAMIIALSDKQTQTD